MLELKLNEIDGQLFVDEPRLFDAVKELQMMVNNIRIDLDQLLNEIDRITRLISNDMQGVRFDVDIIMQRLDKLEKK